MDQHRVCSDRAARCICGIARLRRVEHGLASPDGRHAAEDFRLTDLEGKSQSLGQYRGKIVLVNFWATWCKPCTTEMPAMQTAYEKLRDKEFCCARH